MPAIITAEWLPPGQEFQFVWVTAILGPLRRGFFSSLISLAGPGLAQG